jgi:hypothetical protein
LLPVTGGKDDYALFALKLLTPFGRFAGKSITIAD